MYRMRGGKLEVFLAHPGGPLFARRDEGVWTIPKGEIEQGEDFLTTALREFREEVGISVDPESHFIELGWIRQKGGKIVHGWGVENDVPVPSPLRSNTFAMEWPPRSGKFARYPEVDRAAFFPLEEAKRQIKETQVPLLERLAAALGIG
jgi:predicted NUDIX family NTP pyrophosphohydrolase